MLTATGTAGGGGGRKLLILGLSRVNLDRLTAGEPIRLCPETHLIPPGWEVLILFGETEDAILGQLTEAGLVPAGREAGESRS